MQFPLQSNYWVHNTHTLGHFWQLLTGTKRFGKQGTHHGKVQTITVQYTKTVARNNELPIQSLRNSLLQRWLLQTAFPAKRIMWEGFSLFVLGIGWTLVLQTCHFSSCLLPRTMHFSMGFFPVSNPWAANYALLTNLISAVSPCFFEQLYSV